MIYIIRDINEESPFALKRSRSGAVHRIVTRKISLRPRASQGSAPLTGKKVHRTFFLRFEPFDSPWDYLNKKYQLKLVFFGSPKGNRFCDLRPQNPGCSKCIQCISRHPFDSPVGKIYKKTTLKVVFLYSPKGNRTPVFRMKT